MRQSSSKQHKKQTGRNLPLLIWKAFIFSFISFLLPKGSFAITAELTIGYQYFRRTFDDLNYLENQALSGGMSFFLAETFALELAYTEGLFLRKERESALGNNQAQRISIQKTKTGDLSVIWLLSDRRSSFQPFLRIGASYIMREQTVQIDNDIPFSVRPPDAISPSGGAGLRLLLGERLSLRFSVDTIQMPINDNQIVFDWSTRASLSWIL